MAWAVEAAGCEVEAQWQLCSSSCTKQSGVVAEECEAEASEGGGVVGEALMQAPKPQRKRSELIQTTACSALLRV